MKHLNYIFLLLFLIGLMQLSCKPKDETNTFPTEILVNVQKYDQTLLQNATVYLYTNEDDYFQNQNPIAVQQTDASGKTLFTNLQNNIYYYFRVIYQDNNGQMLSNYNHNYKLNYMLIAESLTEVKIVLYTNTRYVAFWTDNQTVTQNPITVSLNGNNLGSISNVRSSQPTLTDQTNSVMNTQDLSNGVQTWYAKSGGCVWQDTISLGVGDFKPIKIDVSECVIGTINFYGYKLSNVKYPITVTLDHSDSFIVNSSNNSSVQISNCQTASVGYKVYRAYGKHVFKAVSADGKCTWTGTIDLKSGNNCEIVEFNSCQ